MAFSGAPVAAAKRLTLGSAEFYWLMNRACCYGDPISVQWLLDAGADPSGVKDYAAFHKKYQFGFEPSWPLSLAARGEPTNDYFAKIVRLLLKAGANPNLAEGEDVTALTLAAERGNLEIVVLLLDAGADKDHRTFEGTALDLAVKNNHSQVAALLQKRTR